MPFGCQYITYILPSQAFLTTTDDFREEIFHINPQAAPPGPPLLDAGEGAIMANFWNDPNDLSLNFNSNAFDQVVFGSSPLPVWPQLFEDQQGSMLSNHYNMSAMSSPVERRPHSRQEQAFSPQNNFTQSQEQAFNQRHFQAHNRAQPQEAARAHNPGMVHMHGQDSTTYDESHEGASALVNLFQTARSAMMPHRHPEISPSNPATSGTFSPHVLSAEQYTPTTNATFQPAHMPAHAQSMANFPQGNVIHQGNMATRYGATGHGIPAGLQFDSDMSFTPPTRGNNPFGYIPPTQSHTDDERAIAHMTYNNYSPAATHTHTAANGHSTEMAPPARVANAESRPVLHRTNTNTTAPKDKDEQATKRRRTLSFPQSTVQPAKPSTQTPKAIKKEQQSPRPASSASSPSASQSDSPRAGKSPKSAAKRRSSVTAASATPGPSASAKRAKLSDAQRKENHIQSEKRRRQEMKKGYDGLDRLVPSLKAGTLSKAQVLQHTVVYLEALLSGNDLAERKLAELEAKAGAQSHHNTGRS